MSEQKSKKLEFAPWVPKEIQEVVKELFPPGYMNQKNYIEKDKEVFNLAKQRSPKVIPNMHIYDAEYRRVMDIGYDIACRLITDERMESVYEALIKYKKHDQAIFNYMRHIIIDKTNVQEEVPISKTVRKANIEQLLEAAGSLIKTLTKEPKNNQKLFGQEGLVIKALSSQYLPLIKEHQAVIKSYAKSISEFNEDIRRFAISRINDTPDETLFERKLSYNKKINDAKLKGVTNEEFKKIFESEKLKISDKSLLKMRKEARRKEEKYISDWVRSKVENYDHEFIMLKLQGDYSLQFTYAKPDDNSIKPKILYLYLNRANQPSKIAYAARRYDGSIERADIEDVTLGKYAKEIKDYFSKHLSNIANIKTEEEIPDQFKTAIYDVTSRNAYKFPGTEMSEQSLATWQKLQTKYNAIKYDLASVARFNATIKSMEAELEDVKKLQCNLLLPDILKKAEFTASTELKSLNRKPPENQDDDLPIRKRLVQVALENFHKELPAELATTLNVVLTSDKQITQENVRSVYKSLKKIKKKPN